jgi:hypothetical protein
MNGQLKLQHALTQAPADQAGNNKPSFPLSISVHQRVRARDNYAHASIIVPPLSSSASPSAPIGDEHDE